MNKYTITINHEQEIEANNEQEAYEKFWDGIYENNEIPTTFLDNIIEITEQPKIETYEQTNINYDTATNEHLQQYYEEINNAMSKM